MLEVIVECAGDVFVGDASNCRVDTPRLVINYLCVAQTYLVIVRHEKIGGVLEKVRLRHVNASHALHHLFVVERRIIGVAFVEANVLCRVNEKRIDILGDFRNLVPVGFLGIVDGIIFVHCLIVF